MCSPRKSDENFLILTFLWIKTNVAYTRLEVIAKQPSALQVEFITGVKLICYFVLHYCFLHWAHPPNMAVSDLDFYYTLYLCIWQTPDDWKGLRHIIRYTKGLFLLKKKKLTGSSLAGKGSSSKDLSALAAASWRASLRVRPSPINSRLPMATLT